MNNLMKIKALSTVPLGQFAQQMTLLPASQIFDEFLVIVGNKSQLLRWGLQNHHCIPEGDIPKTNGFLDLQIESSDVWFIHRWYPHYRNLIIKYQSSKLIVVIMWGPEYIHYGRLNKPNFLYEPLTKSYMKTEMPSNSILSFVKRPYRYFYWSLRKRQELIALRKVDAVIFAFQEEAEFAKPLRLPTLHTEDLRYLYDPPLSFESCKLDFHCVQIGHCSDPSQNHLDTIELLKPQANQIKEVIIPLSYGLGTKKYIDTVETSAKKAFGNKVRILRNFLPYSDYTLLTKKCGIVVFNHTHQKALGNCTLALKRGARLVLNSRGITHKYFKRLGITIDTLQSLQIEKLQQMHTKQIQWKNFSRYQKKFNLRTNEVFFEKILNLLDKD